MRLLFVFPQARLISIALVAEIAFEALLLSLMLLHVLSQIASANELLVTDRALIWLLTAVYPLVSNQITDLRE